MFPTFKTFEYHTPGRKVFGINTVDNITEYLKKYIAPSGKAIIVTDPTIAKIGHAQRVADALVKGGYTYAIYEYAVPEPNDKDCDAAVEFARKEGGNFVIGVGGGSTMDIAKVTAQLLVLPGNTKDYLPSFVFPKKGAPFVAITTTAGTGSECTQYAIVNFSEDNIKGFFNDPNILADLAIVDPTLLLNTPSKVTAATGVDALSHAIEASLSNCASPVTDALAIKAIALLAEALPVAVYDTDNLDARVKVAYGSFLAAEAFQDAGIVEGHALAHTLGSVYHVPHGVACAIGLPYVMEINMGHRMEKLVEIGAAMGVKVEGLSNRDAALATIMHVKQFIVDVGLPYKWDHIGKREDFPKIIEMMSDCFWITAFYLWGERTITKEIATELVERSFTGRIGDGIAYNM